MGTVEITETEIKITYPNGEVLVFENQASPSYSVGNEFIKFEGITYFLKKQ